MSNQDQVYSSGGANNTTGREPFSDSTGVGNTGTGLSSGHHSTTSGLTGTSTTGAGGVGHHLTDNTSGDIRAGTASDPAVGQGRATGAGLAGSGLQQTGDQYGGVQTGTTSTGTGFNTSTNDKPSIGEKIKEKLTGDSRTSHSDDHSSTGLTGGSNTHGSNTYGSGLTGSNTNTHGSSYDKPSTGEKIKDALTPGDNTHSTSGTHSHSQHEGHHHHGTGTGTGLSSGGIGATGTLGAGTSTQTKDTPTGTHNFEQQPIDKTTGAVHEFTTTSTSGTGIGSGLSHGTGVGHEHGHSHGHGEHGSSTHYGSNTTAGDYDRNTSGLTGGSSGLTGSGSGLTGSHSHGTGSGLTGSSHVTGQTGGNEGVPAYDSAGRAGTSGLSGNTTSGGNSALSSGAAGTDRFDVDRSSSGAYGHDVDDKRSNDHTLGTRHGNDFTGGDTKDAAYRDPGRTGLTGRESTTTGVQDSNLEGTGGPHKEGLLEKVKNVFTHSNTNAADNTTASKTETGHGH